MARERWPWFFSLAWSGGTWAERQTAPNKTWRFTAGEYEHGLPVFVRRPLDTVPHRPAFGAAPFFWGHTPPCT